MTAVRRRASRWTTWPFIGRCASSIAPRAAAGVPRRAPLLAGLLYLLCVTACATVVRADGIAILEPTDLHLVQRGADGTAAIRVRGRIDGPHVDDATVVEAGFGTAAAWRSIPHEGGDFAGSVRCPAGGWHRLRVRAVRDGEVVAEAAVDRVGVGEIFVVAGQSNSANHGEERQRPATDRVVTFDGTRWRVAEDPQPGASGGGGSFMPPLGDAIVAGCDVPVGFIACGIGATSVREWLPAGVSFPAPPTIEARVRRTPDGRWESDGRAFADLVARMKQPGPRGFRAVLWHQGESDANQRDPSRTLPGTLYREFLGTVITESRTTIGWDAPWFVAVATYHVPGDEAWPDIRAAQAAVVRDGLAVAGPDTDALAGPLRERGGTGVHFSAAGLRAHGAAWAERLVPWIRADGTAAGR